MMIDFNREKTISILRTYFKANHKRNDIREREIKRLTGCSITSINEQQYLRNMSSAKTVYDF